jgi:hypothetical protein
MQRHRRVKAFSHRFVIPTAVRSDSDGKGTKDAFQPQPFRE